MTTAAQAENASEVKSRVMSLLPWGDLIVRGGSLHPDRDVFVFPESRRTYAEMVQRATDVGRGLVALGIGKGDHVGILMPNCMDFLDVWFGISFIGAVAVPINARFKSRELGHVINDGDLVAVFTSDIVEQHTSYVTLLHEALPGLHDAVDPTALSLECAPKLRITVLLGSREVNGFLGREQFEAMVPSVSPDRVDGMRRGVAIRDTAVIFYTSGTTAMPKGCPLDHETLLRVGMNTRRRMGLVSGDRLWDPLPLFHTAATQPMVAILDAIGTYVSMTHFEPAAALQLIRRERVTSTFTAFPIITQALLNHPDYTDDDLRSVRTTFNVAPTEALKEMQSKMPYTIQITGFGMTESGGSVVLSRPEDSADVRAGAEGAPFPGMEIEIRDLDSNEPVPSGERGEIVVRGPQIFGGYLKAPDKNAETIEPSGWFHTGDLGALDQDGKLHYLGRAKDMLKVGGENVAAVEIESYLATHSAVSIAQVVGIPDPRYVEVAAAFLELKPGAVATEEEIIEFCAKGMARFKVPRYVRFVTTWPMSATKVQKFRLRDILVDELDKLR
jgi:acyl-CoA synthetase (AMP-forming)/AMP-acid ligase II